MPFGGVGGLSAPNDSVGARPYKAIGTHPNFFGDRRLKSHAGHFRESHPCAKNAQGWGTHRPGRQAFAVLLWRDLVNYAPYAPRTAAGCRAVEVPCTVEHNAAVDLAPVSPAGEAIQQGVGPLVVRARS